MKKLLLCLCGISVMLSSCVALEAYPPNIALERDCIDPELDYDTRYGWQYTAKVVPPVTDWRFQLDPDDVGQAQAWYAIDADLSAWDTSAPGLAWEEQGYEDYDGIAWYSASFAPKDFWDTFYLGLADVDDDATLWVNGVETDWRLIADANTQVIALPVEPVTITIRVVDEGGFGGIKTPVNVGRTPFDVLTDSEYVRWLAAQNPDWPMPGWARDAYYAWAFTGQFRSDHEALLTTEGSVAPWGAAPTVALLLRDRNTGELLQPQPEMSLLDEVLPIPKARWNSAGLDFDTTLITDFNEFRVNWEVGIQNPTDAPIEADLIAVVRPFRIHRDMYRIHGIAFDRGNRIWVNGDQPYMQFSATPDAVLTGAYGEVIESLAAGTFSGADKLECAAQYDGSAAAVFALDIAPGERYDLNLVFPNKAAAPFPASSAGSLVPDTGYFVARDLDLQAIQIPDEFVWNGYRASYGFLQIAADDEGIRPGPGEHNAIWIRDLAYIGEALLANNSNLINDYLSVVFELQTAEGLVPPVILQANGQLLPRPDTEEWDSQGQAIFLIAETYRYQQDITLLEAYYDNVLRAAQFIQQLRTQTVDNPVETRGLLPPSLSAEDLGPDTYHHYWDDYWSVAGLEDAAFIATTLGHTDDAAWMLAEADALRTAIHDSVTAVMGPEPAYIPGAPENIESSAMARGTGPSMFPAKIWEWDDPLLERSFDEYHQRWINPANGGYVHIYGQYWPYGGLGLARNYLRLGRQDVVHQILGWTLTHQTIPGTFVWAEQVSPEQGGISGGDMPHAWAMANYMMLIREMLVLRDGDTLEVFAGVPPSWLEAGKEIRLNGLTTAYGPIEASIDSTLTIVEDDWTGTLDVSLGSAAPPNGFRWRLQQLPDRVISDQDVILDGEWLYIPSGGAEFQLVYE